MISRAPFGATGHDSSRVIFGAAALAQVGQREADDALPLLLEHGINHIDTAASYGDSELRLAPWLRQHRDDFFLATKTLERTYRAAREDIRRSLERLGVDHVDLIQLHYLVHPGEWDEAMGEAGVLEAAVEARDEGLARFIGVTGHGLTVAEMHSRSLARFPFDSVLLPYNLAVMQDTQYAADFDRLLDLCREHGVAVQTIKGVCRGPWGSKEPTAATWYEPLEEQDDIDLAVHWVLGSPDVFLNSVGDLRLLPAVLDAAERFEARPSNEQMAGLLEDRRLTSLFA